jgi:hypothetical protein
VQAIHTFLVVLLDEQPHGQSRPDSAFAVMNSVPSGGLPNTSSVEGLSLMPASAASFA